MIEIRLIRAFFGCMYLLKNPVMVDVGAHVGSTTYPFARLGWRVYCFEPNPENYQLLTRNLRWFIRAKLFRAAVSDSDGETDFFISDKFWGIHSLKPFDDSHTSKIRIRTTTLTTFLSEMNIDRLDFLKIDAEGADFLVLKGMNWRRYRPRIVMTEFVEDRTRQYFNYSSRDVVSFMREIGYRCMVFSYKPVTSNSVQGVDAPSPEFLGASPYDQSANFLWGNLVFCLQDAWNRLALLVNTFSGMEQRDGTNPR